MSVNYRFESNIVVIEMAGEYSTNDLRTTILNALTDSLSPANSFLAFNFGESRSIYKRSPEEIKIMADFISSLGSRFNNRVAFVAPENLPHGLTRITSARSDNWAIESKSFRSFDDARKWLES